jgi:ATP-dependent DNA helicase RecQ
MSINYPITFEELADIQGVGKGKAKRYGKEFIALINKYVEENEIERPQDFVVKTIAKKSKYKVHIIQHIDLKMNLRDLARAQGMDDVTMIKEMEAIVFSGTKLDIAYHLDSILDEEQQEEIYEYFREADSDSISEAFEEFDEDYSEEELRLIRMQFHSDLGN